MLHPQYFREGSQIELPELSGYVPHDIPLFDVLGVHAGGMGVCVHLRQCETGSQYALKSVRPDKIGDRLAVDRFFDELQVWLSASMCGFVAEAIAVVRINESPCVLGAWMKKGDLAHGLPHLTSHQKFECLIRMVRGLSWVRDNLGIIHRDLKPANVLLDEDSLAYVADWGLARPIGQVMASVRTSLSEGVIERPDRTQPGSFMGTVTYAAPEQILGATDIDHRADIYALGCMMFEFETGSPPFTGRTISEIARQHIQTPPPKLGGRFKRTELGLENVIAKCLAKRATDRYSTYDELNAALVELARQHGVSLNRCTVTTRYERAQLGKGHLKQNLIIERAPVKGTHDIRVVEFRDVVPFLEEAINLMALERYEEAEGLLRPHILTEFLDTTDQWLLPHSLMLNYALCLLRLGRSEESIAILERLDSHKNKPAEFYVNYSLALLHVGSWQAAVKVCKRGLRRFPVDLDIQGNQTIALLNCDRLDDAQESAIKRLQLRRDVHSIEEAVGVLQRQAATKRDANLPKAVATAKLAADLVKEGLSLNPRHHVFQIQQVQIRRFAYDESKVLDLCQAMIDSDDCPVSYRQLAFAEMVATLAEGKSFNAALDLLRKVSSLSDRLLAIKMRTLARHFMIGKDDANGQRIVIREVRDYFLPANSGESYPDPVMAAEILEWLGKPDTALSVLSRHLSVVPNDWAGVKAMALFHLRMGMPDDAMKYAQMLSVVAPWRAESYDWLSYVAQQLKRPDIAQQAKRRADEVFQQEDMLFEELRASLDA